MELNATNTRTTTTHRAHTILLGDDDPGVRDLLTELLTAEGFDVIVAEDRQRAVEIYQQQQEKIDLVLLDMSKSRLSVEDALAVLRATNAAAKVLLLTGNSTQERVEETMRKGFNALIPKPFTFSELLEPLHRLVDADECAAVLAA